MKNIIIPLIILVLTAGGIYFSINNIDEKYQSTIAVAIATAGIQLILFFLKPSIDNALNRNTKTFGVIYEKKFIVYNSVIQLMFESKNAVIFYLMEGNDKSADFCVNELNKLSNLITFNRLLIDEDIYNKSNSILLKLLDIYKIKENDRSLKNEFNYYYNSFFEDLINLENIMRDKLKIEPLR